MTLQKLLSGYVSGEPAIPALVKTIAYVDRTRHRETTRRPSLLFEEAVPRGWLCCEQLVDVIRNFVMGSGSMN